MTEKHRKAQRIDEIIGALLILAGVLWVLYAVFSTAAPSPSATHPAEVSRLDQPVSSAAAMSVRLEQESSARMGIQG